MNIEFNDFEKTVLKHASKKKGMFQRLSFFSDYIDDARAKEVLGMSKYMIRWWEQKERNAGGKLIINDYPSGKETIRKAQFISAALFQQKETGDRLEANHPYRKKCRA